MKKFTKKGKGKINFEDDVVEVYDAFTLKRVYHGLEDYEPMNRENWKYDAENRRYFLSGINESGERYAYYKLLA